MIKIGVLVPAIVVSMAACGAANAQGTGSNEAAAAETKETKAEGTDQAAEAKVYTNGDYKRSWLTRSPLIHPQRAKTGSSLTAMRPSLSRRRRERIMRI